MKTSFWMRLDVMARNLAPFLLTLMLLLISLVQTHIPGFGPVMPMLVLMSVYYWAIYRPDLMPLSVVFLIGLTQDLLSGGPIGVQAVVLLICYWLVAVQRRFFHSKSFGVVWWGFMLLGMVAALLNWSLVALVERSALAPWPVLFSYALSIALFPFMTKLLVATHRTLPHAEEGP